MLKLCTGCPRWAWISAATSDESVPPDRNAPQASGECMRAAMAFCSTASSWSVACSRLGAGCKGSCSALCIASRAHQ
ncbi:hypothetical protein G6F40_016640 [Rhizopus arrhizus]|nr:hypothetical protein G6F40_016640 [Rhizopus arrhizus]